MCYVTRQKYCGQMFCGSERIVLAFNLLAGCLYVQISMATIRIVCAHRPTSFPQAFKGAMKTKYKFGAFERLPRDDNIGTTFIANFTQINYVMRKTRISHATHQLLFRTEFKMYYGTLVSIG